MTGSLGPARDGVVSLRPERNGNIVDEGIPHLFSFHLSFIVETVQTTIGEIIGTTDFISYVLCRSYRKLMNCVEESGIGIRLAVFSRLIPTLVVHTDDSSLERIKSHHKLAVQFGIERICLKASTLTTK
jgi:hypothetical protein